MNELDKFDLIEKYLDGELTEQEKNLFESKLHDDPEFAKEFELRKELAQQLIKANEYKTTKENIKNILNEKSGLILKTKHILAIAASIIIIVGLYFIFTGDSKQNDENIIATDTLEYLKPKMDKQPLKADIEYYNDTLTGSKSDSVDNNILNDTNYNKHE